MLRNFYKLSKVKGLSLLIALLVVVTLVVVLSPLGSSCMFARFACGLACRFAKFDRRLAWLARGLDKFDYRLDLDRLARRLA